MFKGHADYVNTFCADDKKRFILSGSKDSMVFVWDIQQLIFKKMLIGHKDQISSLDINKSDIIASGSWDQTVLLHRVSDIGL